MGNHTMQMFYQSSSIVLKNMNVWLFIFNTHIDKLTFEPCDSFWPQTLFV